MNIKSAYILAHGVTGIAPDPSPNMEQGADGFYYYTGTSIYWIFSAAALVGHTGFRINSGGAWKYASQWIPAAQQSTGWVLIYLSPLSTASGAWWYAGLGNIGVTASTSRAFLFAKKSDARKAILTGNVSKAITVIGGAMRNGCWTGTTFVSLDPDYTGIWLRSEKLNGAEYFNTLGEYYISTGFECYGNDGYTTGEHAGTAYFTGSGF